MQELIVYILPFFTGVGGILLGCILRKNKKQKQKEININELADSIELYKIAVDELSKKTLRRINDLKHIQETCNEHR